MAEKRPDLKWKIIISLCFMALIFVQSALPADLSSAESGPLALFLSHLTGWDSDTSTFLIRKAGHFSEYLLLGISFMVSVKAILWRKQEQWKSFLWRYALIAWAAGTVYAVSDEFHQSFVPGRSCELRDICIDAAGVLVGVLAARIFYHYKTRK